jgi:Ca2+-binding RTX toxin-like protein
VFYNDESSETFTIGNGSDLVDPPVVQNAPEGKYISSIEFATPDSGPRAHTSDYLIHQVSYQPVFITYALEINAQTTDIDGSESLTELLVSTPEGVHLSDGQLIETVDGVSSWLLFVNDLANDANDFAGTTVTTHDAGHISISGLTVTVPTSFEGDLVVKAEAVAYDPDAPSVNSIAVTGNEADNALIGGDEDNILTSGAGNDILSGGEGADLFVWNQGDDVASTTPASDWVIDFNASEGDALDLSDMLEGDAVNHIADYLTLLQQGDDVVIQVKPQGESGDITQLITLQNTTVDNLVGFDVSGMSDVDVLNNLVGSGQLIVDAS